jgi:hypothetical protein
VTRKVQDSSDAAMHLAAVSILNATLRLPQAVYLLRLKPNDWSSLLKCAPPLPQCFYVTLCIHALLQPIFGNVLLRYCTDIVGNAVSQRCVTSLAVTAALRFMNCDPATVTISKCLLWHHPTKTDHMFLMDKKTWTSTQPLELSVLAPFISSSVPPHIALAFASRLLAACCDLDAAPLSTDEPQALRLTSLVSLFVGYASLVHLKAPIAWMQHAQAVMTFWAGRFGVDADRVLQALQVNPSFLPPNPNQI